MLGVSSSNSAAIAALLPPTPCILAWRGDGPRRLTFALATAPSCGNSSFDASITTGAAGGGGVADAAVLPLPALVPAAGVPVAALPAAGAVAAPVAPVGPPAGGAAGVPFPEPSASAYQATGTSCSWTSSEPCFC